MKRNQIECIPITVTFDYCIECNKVTPFDDGYCFYCHSTSPLGDPYDDDISSKEWDDWAFNKSVKVGGVVDLDNNTIKFLNNL